MRPPRAIAVALVVLASAVAMGAGVMAMYHIPWPGTHPPALEVTASWWVPAPAFRKREVRGRVRNNTDYRFREVTVELEMQNEARDSTGVVACRIGPLSPRETRAFSTGPLPETPPRYRIRSIHGD